MIGKFTWNPNKKMTSDIQNTPRNPADEGFYMPAEWELHSRTWMAWPCREEMWSNKMATRQAYANVANTISEFEPVNMLACPRDVEDARHYLGDKAEVIEMPIDDSWTRDTGPNFLVNTKGELAGSCWSFNAWAGMTVFFYLRFLLTHRFC